MANTQNGVPGRSWSIRTRLALLLAVPTTVLLVVAGVGVATQAGEVGRVDETVRSVSLVLRTQDVIHELQRERGLSAGLIGGESRFRAQLDQQRAKVDRVRAEWEQQLRTSEAGRAVAAASGRLDDLGPTRQRIDARAVDTPETIAFFTSLIADLGGAADRWQAETADAEILRGLTTLRAISQAKEATGYERAYGNGVFAAGSFRGRTYQFFNEARARRLAGLDSFRAVAAPAELDSLDAALDSPPARTATGIEQRALDGATRPVLGINPQQWYDTMTGFVDGLRTTQQVVGSDIGSRADAVQSQARFLLVVDAVLALLAVVGIVALALAAVRAVVRPVRRLAEHADDVAQRWLPQAVAQVQASAGGDMPDVPRPLDPLADRDRGAREIVELGTALGNVQQTALRLAAEQAVLRHNTATSLGALGRRNQNLVRRQLGLIDDLERDESDPDTLAELFTLDHLATRMRRNAESVLVLVGERTTRRWADSVAAEDVLRAAVSEVEDYARVQTKSFEAAAVTGASAADITHIAAELLENALAFSPPDRPVELYGQRVPGGYLVAIVDHGSGMDDQALTVANARLRADEQFLVAPTRFLGHYVVGTLARRLGVGVHLQRSPLTGLTARITIPSSLLAVVETPVVPVDDAPAVPAGTVAEVDPPVGEDEPAVVAEAPVPEAPAAEDDPDIRTEGFAAPRERPETPPGPRTLGRPAASSTRPGPRGPGDQGGPPRRGAPATTRNGLVKRQRGTVPAGAAGDGATVNGSAVNGSAPARSPEQVRSMLSDFRSGYTRSPGTAPVETAPADADESAEQRIEEEQ